MLPAPAADIDTKLVLQRGKSALQRADNARCDPRGVPVHAHDGAERLKPEGMRKPLQEFIAAVVMHDGLRDDRTEARHPLGKPPRNAAAVKRKISAAPVPAALMDDPSLWEAPHDPFQTPR